MAEDSSQEKTEEATPRRKQDARKKGTVAKSIDLNSALLMVILIVMMPAIVAGFGRAFTTSLKTGFSTMPMDVSFGSMTRYIWTVASPGLIALAPLLGIAMVVGVASNLGQVGFMMSTEAISPKLEKLNPLNGLKRLLSKDSIVETIKASVKTALFAYIAWKVISDNWGTILYLSWNTPQNALSRIGSLIYTVFMRISVVWLALAAIDYFYQRKRVDKQLMMTKQEVKQEFKEIEQSPELKGAMHRMRRKLSRMRMSDAVKSADVILTNPTHFSVALKYDPQKMHAPMVVAKGADLLAFRIRELAKKSRVPILENPPLARQLYKKCEVGEFVPRELFQAVAEVLAYVYRTIKKVRAA